MISTGRSKSRNAFSEYPVVFFIRYLARMRSARRGSCCRNFSSASEAAVSMTVPEGRTKVRESRVW